MWLGVFGFIVIVGLIKYAYDSQQNDRLEQRRETAHLYENDGHSYRRD